MSPHVLQHARLAASIAILLIGTCAWGADAPAPEAVQLDLSRLLTSRLVVTAKDGVTVPLSADQRKRPYPAAMITAAAAKLAGIDAPTLPDDGVFPANHDHPEVKLPYGDADAGSQVRMSDAKTDLYLVPVPPGRYARLQLFFVSNHGRTPIAVALRYVDGSADQRTTTVMDWYNPPGPADPGWTVLAADLCKVTSEGKLAEGRHHYINGFDLAPDPAKELKELEVVKEPSGSELVLFGATAVKAGADPAK
jgi:hypothetical protein